VIDVIYLTGVIALRSNVMPAELFAGFFVSRQKDR
jgi:hypothetical protein